MTTVSFWIVSCVHFLIVVHMSVAWWLLVLWFSFRPVFLTMWFALFNCILDSLPSSEWSINLYFTISLQWYSYQWRTLLEHQADIAWTILKKIQGLDLVLEKSIAGENCRGKTSLWIAFSKIHEIFQKLTFKITSDQRIQSLLLSIFQDYPVITQMTRFALILKAEEAFTVPAFSELQPIHIRWK
jgi:hypothetical protein